MISARCDLALLITTDAVSGDTTSTPAVSCERERCRVSVLCSALFTSSVVRETRRYQHRTVRSTRSLVSCSDRRLRLVLHLPATTVRPLYILSYPAICLYGLLGLIQTLSLLCLSLLVRGSRLRFGVKVKPARKHIVKVLLFIMFERGHLRPMRFMHIAWHPKARATNDSIFNKIAKTILCNT